MKEAINGEIYIRSKNVVTPRMQMLKVQPYICSERCREGIKVKNYVPSFCLDKR